MPAEPDGSEIVILVVDGDVVARNLTATMLHRDGYTVLAAAHGKEALDLSRTYEGRLDLLIADMDVSKMDAMQLGETMRQERPELKVLAVSGRASDAERAAGRSVPFLLKPLDPALLRRKFREILT